MPETRHLDVAGKRIRVLVGGRGAPLVYLHSAALDVEWGEAHERLAERHTVYAPTAPGFADSTGLEALDGIFDLALHTLEVLDALELRRVPLAGTSFGGWIAAEVATYWPERVERLVLCDAVGLWLDECPPFELFATRPPELAPKLYYDLEQPVPAMMRLWTPTMVIPEEILLPQLKAMEALARVGWNPYLHDPKLPERLRRVRAPTLVLWGRQDGIVPPPYAERWAALIRGARVAWIDRCGHLPPVERPAEFAAAVAAFLATPTDG